MGAAGDADQLRGVLVKLEKTRRTLRLYGAANAVVSQMTADLAAAAGALLGSHGACELEVRESGLWLGDEEVMADGQDPQSLPFLLFRDGVRGLSLLPGLDRPQLVALLECVNRVSLPASDDDLVTLLWERDLPAVRTVVVEDLEAEVPNGEETAHERPTSAPLTGFEVRLDDLRSPVSRLPASECQLTDAELARLHAELATEEREDPLPLALSLVLELVLLEPDEEDWRVTVEVARQVLERALGQGAVGQVAAALDDLRTAAVVFDDHPHAARLVAELAQAVATSDQLVTTLEGVASGRTAVSPDDLGSLLELVVPAVLPVLLALIPRLPEGEHRRVAVAAAMSPSAGGVEGLLSNLPVDPAARTVVLGEVLEATRQRDPAAAVAVARQALASGDPELRRQAATALGPHQDGATGVLWQELLTDADPELRRLAVAAMVRTGRPELAQPIADETLQPDFADRPFEEKQRFFIAVARLGGDRCLPWFASLLEQPLPRWFVSRQARDTLAAVASALAAVRSPGGRALLERLSRTGERAVRAACREAVKGAESHGRE